MPSEYGQPVSSTSSTVLDCLWNWSAAAQAPLEWSDSRPSAEEEATARVGIHRFRKLQKAQQKSTGLESTKVFETSKSSTFTCTSLRFFSHWTSQKPTNALMIISPAKNRLHAPKTSTNIHNPSRRFAPNPAPPFPRTVASSGLRRRRKPRAVAAPRHTPKNCCARRIFRIHAAPRRFGAAGWELELDRETEEEGTLHFFLIGSGIANSLECLVVRK